MEGISINKINGLSLLARLDRIEAAIEKSIQPATAKLLTRKQVAEMFGITLPTVWDWTKKNILTAYKIGNKVYYKLNEVEAALTQISGERN